MRKTPSSTYRLQLHAGFNFEAASDVADYLAALGVSHVYSSPYLQTAPGSMHGYDVADFKSVNTELGGEEAQQKFSQRLGENGLGQILDIVPNHMALVQNNPYWRDVLENGSGSRYAEYFDINWETDEERLRNKVLLPVLDNQYGIVLSNGGMKLERDGKRFHVLLNGSYLPVAPSSMPMFFAPAAKASGSDELAFFSDCLAQLAPMARGGVVEERNLRRHRYVLLALLDRYLSEDPKTLDYIDEAIAAINGSTDAMDMFLQQQHYRLAYWRAADQDLGYRRFFDVNSLIGVRVEREEVFLETHELILRWLKSGVIDGVRVDHADGLRDPQGYFERLASHAPEAWIVAEKILARNEALSDQWPVAGTTGYDLLNQINGLLIDPRGLTELDDIYQGFLGAPVNLAALIHEKKIAITVEILGSDVNRLTSIFLHICEADRDHRDHTRAEIRHAIREVASCFTVYRSYVSPDRDEIPELDAAVIQTAIDVAYQYRPDIDRGLYDFMADVLLMRRRGTLESEFLLRFQQFTSPVMAKGFEDTSLYCYNRLIGLNEVGCNLGNPVVTIEEFHRFNTQAQQRSPLGMVTLSTHDTKRGEDLRARLAVLSEMPSLFADTVARWREKNSAFRVENLPDPNSEYLYYQTLIGAWPLSEERAQAYMLKATREAKQETSWTHNNAKFEDALRGFITATLNSKSFCAEVDAFVERIQLPGRINSLAQTLLKHTVPGVPDIYQGSELWDHRLVDPDNRGPVDFAERLRLLKEIATLNARQVLERMEEGLPKLWTIYHSLAVRRRYPECFASEGTYTPLLAQGLGSERVVGFLRGDRVAAIVPRLPASQQAWERTTIELPQGEWHNELSGSFYSTGTVLVEELFSSFPVALLTKQD